METKFSSIFPILNEGYNFLETDLTPFPEEEFKEIVDFTIKCGLALPIQNMVINRIEDILRDQICPKFWTHFENVESCHLVFKQFYTAVKFLYDCYKSLCDIIDRLTMLRKQTHMKNPIYGTSSLHCALRLILRSILFMEHYTDHNKIIRNFYETVLRMEDREDNYQSDEDRGKCLYLFEETNKKLGEMQLLESLVGQDLTDFIYGHIHSHIQKTCKDNFDTHFIWTLEKWLQDVVLNWLGKIYSCDSSQQDGFMDMLHKRLTSFLYNSYTKIRIDQLFNIIIEYPESLPALEDLRLCLPRTDLKPLLTKKLQKAMETRLLHPGVSTPDVLTAYVAAIRSLRVLDPTGLLLETVTQPVHQYLRSREDTVRCVVSSLTEEGPNDLAEELVKGEALQTDDNTQTDDDDENWESWVPDPIDSVPSKSSSTRRTSDIISMLVNVYGSKELFVNEYRTLLADRLLTQCNCDTKKEIRYLELLKLRFGDSQLHYCEVMLKDIADSKRINQNIKQDIEYTEFDIPLTAMIVSAQFWPPFKEEKLELHSRVTEQMKKYTQAFETLKGSRTLCWKNHLGVVDIEVELTGRTMSFSVTPIQATVMMHFQDKGSWELEDLSKVMQCPSTILRRKIGFWQSHGILIETSPDVFVIQDDQESKDVNVKSGDVFVDDYEAESAMASAQDQREEELQTFWSYIVGMLMNLDTLPLERIHQMLKMFAFQGPTIECNIQELKVFLDRKVREHHLIYSNGYYKLPK